MATQKFAFHTKPHVAEVGDQFKFLFEPEIMGDDFLDRYGALRAEYDELGLDVENKDLDADQLKATTSALKRFLASLMLPESATEFLETPLPLRLPNQLFQWVLEVYSDGRPPTSPSDSSRTSPPRGPRGTAISPSKASTRARGR